AGAGSGQVVQPASRVRLPDLRGGDPRYLCPHGNAPALWHDGAAPGAICACPVRTGFQGHDGGGDPTRDRFARTFLALSPALWRLIPCSFTASPLLVAPQKGRYQPRGITKVTAPARCEC